MVAESAASSPVLRRVRLSPAAGRVDLSDTVLWRTSKSGKPRARTRAADRYPVSGLACELGEVADLSNTGMRVVARPGSVVPPVGSVGEFTIVSGSWRVRVRGRVVWHRGETGAGPQLGVQFIDLDAEAAAALFKAGSALRRSA